MTDAEILAMLDERNLEDFTPDEIAAVADAARRSPDIARECRARIDLEQCLHEALGRPRFEIDPLFARARRRASRRHGLGRWLALGIAGALCGVLAFVASSRVVRRGGDGGPLPAGDAATPDSAKTSKTAEPRAGQPAEAPPGQPPGPAIAAATTSTPTSPAPADGSPRNLTAEPMQVDAATKAAAERSPVDLLFPLPPAPARGLTRADASRWLEAVAGRQGTADPQQINAASHLKLSGVHRLRATLTPGQMVRLVIQDLDAFQIRAWQGATGAMFATRGWGGAWAAYALSRPDDPATPAIALCGRDDGRMRRTNPQRPMTVDLRHENGLLTLSRGDIRIVEAALGGSPTEILLEGGVVLRDLQMIPTLPLPPLAATAIDEPAGAETVSISGAAAPWAVAADQGGAFEQLPDGRATLTAESNARPLHALLPVPLPTPRAVVIRIDACDPGTGFVLGNAAGKPQQLFTVVANEHDPSLRNILLVQVGDNRLKGGPRPFDEPIAAVGSSFWLRFLHCGGELKCDVSADGVRWARAIDPISNAPAFQSIGVYAAAHASRRSITVAGIETRGFKTITAFPEFADVAGDCTRERALQVLESIGEQGLRATMTTEARLQLLDEIATLAPVWRGPADAAKLAAAYGRVGRLAAAAGEQLPYSPVAVRLQTTPLACREPFELFPVRLAREELCELLATSRAKDLHALGRRAAFFNLPGTPPVFAWAAESTQSGRLADAVRPLVLEPSKAGATVEADLRTALSEDDMPRICDVLATAADQRVGLVPDPTDGDLLADIPTLASALMQDEPRITDAMRERFGPRAELRLRRAIESSDVELLESVTRYAPGTTASAEAHLLLGDRSLAAGRLALARWHYREARGSATPEIAARLAAAATLAAALDQPVGSGPAAPELRLPEGWSLASAVIRIDGALHACLASKERDGGWSIMLGDFSAATGDLLGQRPLLLMRAVAGEAAPACLFTRVDESLLVFCAGGIACCDPAGDVRWIRRQAFIPPVVDPLWKSQSLVPPLATDGTLFVVQPGTPAVVAIHAAGGRAVWKRGCDGARRVLGVDGGPDRRLVRVETADGTMVFRASDGGIKTAPSSAGSKAAP